MICIILYTIIYNKLTSNTKSQQLQRLKTRRYIN